MLISRVELSEVCLNTAVHAYFENCTPCPCGCWSKRETLIAYETQIRTFLAPETDPIVTRAFSEMMHSGGMGNPLLPLYRKMRAAGKAAAEQVMRMRD